MKPKINEIKQFWDKSPCNINHSKKEIGTKEYFEEVEKKKFYVEPHIIKFCSFPSWKNKSPPHPDDPVPGLIHPIQPAADGCIVTLTFVIYRLIYFYEIPFY